MSEFTWTEDESRRFAAIKDDLAGVSTASACQLLIGQGWRDAYMVGLLPLRQAGLGKRLVGRARTCRYLIRRGPVQPHNPDVRRTSPEIVAIESLEPGDILCIDALGVPTSGIIGDILSARMQARGALAAVVHGAVRDSPYIADLNFPVYCSHVHPSHSGRDLMPVAYDQPVNMAGAQVHPGDILLADDEGVLAMPLDMAEYVAAAGPPKERIEAWIRDKVVGGGSIHDYYMPSPEKYAEYESETGERYEH
jgi:regulator of RNase E activity RraA